MDITPEEALGCERTKDRLRLMIAEGRTVDFELIDDPENDRLMLGGIVEAESATATCAQRVPDLIDGAIGR